MDRLTSLRRANDPFGDAIMVSINHTTVCRSAPLMTRPDLPLQVRDRGTGVFVILHSDCVVTGSRVYGLSVGGGRLIHPVVHDLDTIEVQPETVVRRNREGVGPAVKLNTPLQRTEK